MTAIAPQPEPARGPAPFSFAPGRWAVLREGLLEVHHGDRRRRVEVPGARGLGGLPDGSFLVPAPGGGWRVGIDEVRPLSAAYSLGPGRARVMPDGDRFWVASRNIACAYILSGDEAEAVSAIEVAGDAMIPAGDGSLLFAFPPGLVWVGPEGTRERKLTGWIQRLAPGPDGCLWASVNGDTLSLIEPETGRILRSYPWGQILDLDASAEQAAVVTADEVVVLGADGRTLLRLPVPFPDARVVVSRWEPLVAIGTANRVEVWDARRGARVA